MVLTSVTKLPIAERHTSAHQLNSSLVPSHCSFPGGVSPLLPAGAVLSGGCAGIGGESGEWGRGSEVGHGGAWAAAVQAALHHLACSGLVRGGRAGVSVKLLLNTKGRIVLRVG